MASFSFGAVSESSILLCFISQENGRVGIFLMAWTLKLKLGF